MGEQSKAVSILTRLQVIKRDNCTCQVCGRQGIFFYRYGKPSVAFTETGEYPFSRGENYNGKEIEVFEFHHIKAVFLDGTNDLENIQLACRKCNRSQGYQTQRYEAINKLKQELSGKAL